MPRWTQTLEERFWSKVSKSKHGCWEWRGAKGRDGYGSFFIGKVDGKDKIVNAHRASWMINKGVIPTGRQTLHRCDNPSCVRPGHLFLGSQIDNIADMVAKGRQSRLTGSRHPLSRLTEAQVLAIRLARKAGVPLREIEKKYRLTHSHLYLITSRRTWKHV